MSRRNETHNPSNLCFFLLLSPPPPRSTLFPYTTLFRSSRVAARRCAPASSTRARCASSRPDSINSRSTACERDRKSTRLNSSHVKISYAVFCLKKKKYSRYILGTLLQRFIDAHVLRCEL